MKNAERPPTTDHIATMAKRDRIPRMKLPFAVWALTLSFLIGQAFSQTFRPSKSDTWVDLTHAFSAETLYWPTESGFELETKFQGFTPAGYYYVAKAYRAPEHGGTHLDAPIHFGEGRQTVDQIPLDQITGLAVMVDVSATVYTNRDHEVTVDDFKNWERKHRRIRPESIVLIRTGFGERWPDAEQYLGTTAKGPEAVKELHFPGLHPDAARWLVTERKVKAVGIDTASIDHGPSRMFESHRVFCERNIPVFENVANLHQLPPTGAYVIALPMKIKDGSGAPLRIIAQVPKRSRAKPFSTPNSAGPVF